MFSNDNNVLNSFSFLLFGLVHWCPAVLLSLWPLTGALAVCSSEMFSLFSTSAIAIFSSWISSSCIWTRCSRYVRRSLTSRPLWGEIRSSDRTNNNIRTQTIISSPEIMKIQLLEEKKNDSFHWEIEFVFKKEESFFSLNEVDVLVLITNIFSHFSSPGKQENLWGRASCSSVKQQKFCSSWKRFFYFLTVFMWWKSQTDQTLTEENHKLVSVLVPDDVVILVLNYCVVLSCLMSFISIKYTDKRFHS